MRTSWSSISTQVFSSDFLVRQETNNHRVRYNENNHRVRYNENNHRVRYNENNHRVRYNENNHRVRYNENNHRVRYSENNGTTANDIEGIDQDMVESDDASIVSKIVQRIVLVCENEGDFRMYTNLWTDSMVDLNVTTNGQTSGQDVEVSETDPISGSQMSQVSIVSIVSIPTSSNEIPRQEMVTKEVVTSRSSASYPQNIPESVSQSRDTQKVKQEESFIQLVTIDDD